MRREKLTAEASRALDGFGQGDDHCRREKKVTARSDIVDCVSHAIVSHALDGTILSWNSAARRMFGYSSREVVGRNASILFTRDHCAQIVDSLCRFDENENIAASDTVCVRNGGQSFAASVIVSPLAREDGIVIAVSTVVRDLTIAILESGQARRAMRRR